MKGSQSDISRKLTGWQNKNTECRKKNIDNGSGMKIKAMIKGKRICERMKF